MTTSYVDVKTGYQDDFASMGELPPRFASKLGRTVLIAEGGFCVWLVARCSLVPKRAVFGTNFKGNPLLSGKDAVRESLRRLDAIERSTL